MVLALGPKLTSRQGRSMSRKRAKRVTRLGTTRSTGPIDKYFGDRIRARRIMIKMTQEEFGEKLGVSFQQIQKYEKGRQSGERGHDGARSWNPRRQHGIFFTTRCRRSGASDRSKRWR